jgi:hypothetical protein
MIPDDPFTVDVLGVGELRPFASGLAALLTSELAPEPKDEVNLSRLEDLHKSSKVNYFTYF